MAQITSTTLANGLPLHRIHLPGTRATTILVAFDAGARTERPEENGMAHFLEHLVFKGGEKFDDYRKVNETAERMGGSLNAYTSHDLVAFHITVRSESTMEALDLLTDFVGRPKIDQAELDKERGVVIQEIARYKDQPAAVAEELIDRAAFGDHPFGRTVLGPKEHLETFSRDAIIAFRERRWAAREAARSSSATRSTRATTPRSASCSSASRRSTSPGPTSPRPRLHPRSSSSSATPTSRTCG
jgi:predicted Zn-dependent peptidase